MDPYCKDQYCKVPYCKDSHWSAPCLKDRHCKGHIRLGSQPGKGSGREHVGNQDMMVF